MSRKQAKQLEDQADQTSLKFGGEESVAENLKQNHQGIVSSFPFYKHQWHCGNPETKGGTSMYLPQGKYPAGV